VVNFEGFTLLTSSQDEIFSAAYAAAIYISKFLKLAPTDKVYLIGTSGTEAELASQGISWIGGTEDNTLAPFDLSALKLDSNVKAVLCASDQALNYTKLSKAFQYLQGSDHCEFLCAAPDVVVPAKGGLNLGAGALVSPLTAALGRGPLFIGKPERTMWDCIISKYVNSLFIPCHNLTVLEIFDRSKQGTHHW
jgi:4-nitrophenyl phosphatase